MRSALPPVAICVAVSMLGRVVLADATFFQTNTEARIVEFVLSHPEIDYTRYCLDGTLGDGPSLRLVDFAAARNYGEVLAALEIYGAISSYSPGSGMPTPLSMAAAVSATQAVSFLARVRPDWLDVAEGAMGTPAAQALLQGDVGLTRLLLDAGADINATNALGLTLMDIAAAAEVDAFKLVRSRGGLFGQFWPSLKEEIRAALLAEFGATACHAYSNRFVFPSGATLSYPMECLPIGGWRFLPLSSQDAAQLAQAFESLATEQQGTIVIRYHEGCAPGLGRYVIPILEERSLFALFEPDSSTNSALDLKAVFPLLKHHSGP